MCIRDSTHTNTHCQMTGSTVALKSKKRSHPTHCAIGAAGARPALCPVLQQTGVRVTARVHCLTVLSDTNTLCHTGPPTSIHCITLGTQPPTPIQPSTVSHWALSHQQPFSHPQTSFNNNNKTLYEGKYRCATTTKRIDTQWS